MLTEELDKIEEKVDDELGEDVIEEVKKKIKDQSEALLASSLARDKKVSRDESGGNFEEDEEGGLEGENEENEVGMGDNKESAGGDSNKKELESDDSKNKKTKDKEVRSDSSGEETGDDKSFGNESTQNKFIDQDDKEDEAEKESASDDSESKKEAELQVNKKKDKNKDAGKVKGGISQESDEGTSGMAKSLKKLLKTAWQNIIDSFGLTLLYIYAHWFWRQVFPKLFCDLGQEWVPEKISKASPEKAKEIGKKIGCIEKSLVGCTCLIISIIVYPTLVITITVAWKVTEAILEPFGVIKLIFKGFKVIFDLF